MIIKLTPSRLMWLNVTEVGCDGAPISNLMEGFIVYHSALHTLGCLIIKTNQGGRYYPILQMWKTKLIEPCDWLQRMHTGLRPPPF